ncbi:MAG: Crp/Fnr family transcriptional regulator [Pseudomonadota bacterium]
MKTADSAALPDPADWPEEIRAACRPRSVAAGEVLARVNAAPKAMFFVQGGELQLVRHGLDGQPLVLQRVRRGWAAEASLFSTHYHCELVAAQPTALVQVPMPALRQALATSPRFAAYWILQLSTELRGLRARCERLALRRADDRIVHAIELEGTGGRLTLTTSLKDWAAELGLTHEALYRGLARLERSGRLRRQGRALSLRKA